MRHVDSPIRYPLKVYNISTELSKVETAQQKDGHIKAIIEELKEKAYGEYNMKGELLYKTISGNDLLVAKDEIILSYNDFGFFALKKAVHAIQHPY